MSNPIFLREAEASIANAHSPEDLLAQNAALQARVRELEAERDRGEVELEKFRMLVEHASDAHALFDAEGRLLWANRLMSERLGYTLEELQTLTIPDINPHFSPSRYQQLFGRAQRERIPPFEGVHRRKDGSTFPVEITPTVVELAEGARMFSSVRDITERKQAEAALHEAQQRLEIALEGAGMGVWDMDLTTMSARTSPRHDRIFGYTEPIREWGPEIFREHILPEDRDALQTAFARAMETGDFELIVRVRWGDGTVRWIQDCGHVYHDEQGRPVRLVGVTRDVTQAKEAEAERERLLGESEAARSEAEQTAQVMRAINTSLAEGVCMMDSEGRLTYMNPAAERILGWTQAEIEGQVLHDVVHYRHVDGSPFPLHECPLGRVLSEGQTVLEFVDYWIRKDGTFVPLVTTCSPLLGEGQVTGAVLSLHDDTDRRRADEERERLLREMEVARAESEAANRAKSEFLAVMSHELRTPLNAIGGYTELIEMGIRGPVTEAQRTDLARIQSSQRHLLGLINEVLNYAKLETGSVRYDITAVPVEATLRAAVALVDPQAQAKALEIELRNCPPDLAVHADAEKFRQILVNLLSNAVKFTDSGSIELRCNVECEQALIQVRDTGIGIPPEKLEAVFEPFVQVRSDLTRTAEGTGLGLAISRDLARAMSGDLHVESAPGEGSTFTLRLPLLGSEL